MADPKDMQERLDAVEEEIVAAKRGADDAAGIDEDEPRYVDSGSIRPDLDDQQIVPPG